jgi:hypothetical protein
MSRLDSAMNLPPFVVPRQGSIVLFVLIVIAVTSAGVAGIHVARRSVDRTVAFGTTLVVWMAATGTFVAIGGPAASTAGLMGFFAVSNLGAIVLALSPVGRWWATGLPLWSLVAFQGFRLPLEIVLHWWVEDGTIPATMTWTGSNWDIISGVVAIVAAPFARRRTVAWFANVVGLILLANVARVALMSLPVTFGWGVTPPLMLAMHLPYAWIVPICVGGALCGHIVLTRALLVPSRRLGREASDVTSK